jgi:hypothetical protein
MKNITKSPVVWVLLSLSFVSMANAGPIQPVPLVMSATQPPPGQRCTVETLNVGGVVNADGSMFVPNVPTNQGAVRLRATCVDPFGGTLTGQSNPVTLVAGGAVFSGDVDFSSTVSIATKLTVAPTVATLNGLDATLQLAIGSAFANQTTGDVTLASTGTSYKSSNEAVAKVSLDGLVTAIGAGTAIISALNEGAIGMVPVTVRSASLTSLAVTPPQVTISINPAFANPPVQLRTVGSLSDGNTIDLTSASAGTAYVSSAPGVAAVSPDGVVTGISGGPTGTSTSTITVTDTRSGAPPKSILVTVKEFSPLPIAAYDTPGFAHNADISGSLIFVADGPAGLQIFNAFSPTIVGKLAFVNQQALDVKVRGTLAAVALGAGGFVLVDVSNPAQPKSLSVTSSAGVNIVDLWISGNRLYTAARSGTAALEGLRVYDIGNPAAPTLVGSSLGFPANAVAADSARGVVVAATSQPAVRVIRTAGPAPWPQVTLGLPSATNQADDVTLFGTSAYVANGRDGLLEVDVTDPAAPAFKAHSTLNFNALGVAMQTTRQGTIVAAADNLFVNAVPLFTAQLFNTVNVNFSTFPGDIKSDADSTGIALGDGFGVVTVGDAGIQVFRTQQITDNGGSPPVVSITQPTDAAVMIPGGTTTINATATDDVGVSFVEFFAGNVSLGIAGTPPFTSDFVAGPACTTQILTAQATDLQGQVGDSLPVSLKVLCNDGQPCSVNADCANHICAGNVCQASCNSPPSSSCLALKNACPALPSGAYTIDPDGAGPAGSFPVYCDMTLSGGGWTMVAKMTNKDQKHWANAKASWTGTNFYGNTVDLSAGNDAKSAAWSALPASEFLLTDDASYASGHHIRTSSNCLGNMTLSQFFTGALANYPDISGQTEFKKCTVFNNYVPGWTFEPNFFSQDPSSPSNALNQGYLVIAKTDVSDSQAVVSFYADGDVRVGPDYDQSSEPEADVGLGASQEDTIAFGTFGTIQDIGGPFSCFSDDSFCRSDYPQTVFMFAR